MNSGITKYHRNICTSSGTLRKSSTQALPRRLPNARRRAHDAEDGAQRQRDDPRRKRGRERPAQADDQRMSK